MPQILPGGPVPAMPEQPPIDPTQIIPEDPSQVAPEGQVAPEASAGVSEEERQALLDMINTIREKLGSFNATKFAGEGKVEKMRSALLQQVFEKLQLAGVDLTNQESVAAFLAKLQQTNPELAANFEKAMEVLLGGSGMPGSPQDSTESLDLGIPPQNNMNNENPNEQADQTIQNIPQG